MLGGVPDEHYEERAARQTLGRARTASERVAAASRAVKTAAGITARG